MHALGLFMLKLHCIHAFFSTKLSAFAKSDVFMVWRQNCRCLQTYISLKLTSFAKSVEDQIKASYWFIISHWNTFVTQLLYFLLVSSSGLVALKILKPPNGPATHTDIDLFFMSVSASTVSSMATVEMEDFIKPQLWVLTLLMLLGGEVFTSMLELQFMRARLKKDEEFVKRNAGLVIPDLESPGSTDFSDQKAIQCNGSEAAISEIHPTERENLKHSAVKYLGYIVATYLIVALITSSAALLLYLYIVPDARHLLHSRKIDISTFSIFTAVSSFASCRFIPLNENMAIFKKNSILLLLIIPQVLIGSSLFPSCLRFTTWVLHKLAKTEEFNYILQNPREIGYKNLYPQKQTVYMAVTASGFVLVQMVLFCSLEWNSEGLEGMNNYQKFVASVFQIVNSRHAGESVVDFSSLSPAMLVIFVVMMCLPSNTSFYPANEDDLLLVNEKKNGSKESIWKNLLFPQIAYLTMFILLICITEKRALLADPLNFNIFSILFEVVSAYGNVGFSLGYSCKRLLQPDSNCKDVSYGFVGKWSDKGKLIVILVMIVGRLKRFNLRGGEAWKLH